MIESSLSALVVGMMGVVICTLLLIVGLLARLLWAFGKAHAARRRDRRARRG